MKFLQKKATQPEAASPEVGGLEVKKRRTNIWLALAICLFALIVFVLGSLLWYQKNTSAKDPAAETGLFEVNEGDSAAMITANLHGEGYIRSELAFRIALRLSGKEAMIKAGQYRISAAEDARQIINKLESGQADVRNVSIIPGETLAKVRQSLVEVGYKADAVDAALQKEYDHQLLADKPKDASLEGYIYPDTYEVNLTQSPDVLIEKTFDNFLAKLEGSGLKLDSFKAAGLDFHKALTLGSVVEKEVNVAGDRPIVAQVFLKRLEIDMPLGSDATFVYAAEQMGVAPAVGLDSPYNTRLVKGLPPGPISNMTIDALEAVAKPANTDYLYFVTGDDNVTHFAKTAAEHDKNVENYCGERCKL